MSEFHPMPSRAFLTGATGFVGAAVARALLAQGCSVVTLVRPGSNTENLRGLALERVTGDLSDTRSLAQAMRGCDAVFHVAADYRLWVRQPRDIYRSNVEGTVNVMEAALVGAVPQVVYTSSVATLAIGSDGVPGTEDRPVSIEDMIGHYKRSKFLAEQEVLARVRSRGLPAVIVNPSTPIGPGDVKPTPTGKIIRDAVAGKLPAFVDTGLNLVHVDDVARGHLLALQRGRVGERYILGGEDMTLQQILAEVARLVGRRPPKLRVPYALAYGVATIAELIAAATRSDEPLATRDGVRMSRKLMYFSSDKARSELGYTPRPATEALRDAVAWFAQRHAGE